MITYCIFTHLYIHEKIHGGRKKSYLILNMRIIIFQVSWIRKRDLHILTVGILTYTNDQRYQSLHADSSDEWTLRITSPQPRDSGEFN
jgi:hypothetical protein